MRRIALAELGGRGSFKVSSRFSSEVAEPSNSDPVAEAFQKGFAEGRRIAEQEAQARSEEATAAQHRIELEFARFDAESAQLLQDRLRSAVSAICQAMAGEIAVDPARLSARVTAAAAMLRRKHDERIVRLNPADLVLVEARVAPDLRLLADPSLKRGQLRVDGEDGGVEDGAEQWRVALAEALGTCLP